MSSSSASDRPKLPETFEADAWGKLQACVRAVHQQQPVDQSFEELYKAVEDLCIHKLGQNLYDKLASECEQHIEVEIAKLVGLPDDAQLLLETVEAAWHTHCSQMSLIRSIFLYLDRTYVIQSANVCSLWAMGLQLFRKHLEAATELQPRIVAGVLALVHKERAGDMVKRQLLRNLLRMLWHLQLYSSPFEAAFLEASRSFYLEEGRAKIGELDVPTYLLHVERRLQEENERVGHYLDMQTRKPLIAVLDAQLLEVHVQDILDKGLELLMTQHRVSDLQRLYSLLSRVNGLSQIKTGFGALVRRVGTEIVMNEERSGEMVQDLLDLKARMDSILEQAFDSSEELGHALKDAFEALINVRQNRPAEHVAKFIDAQLRSGGKGVSEQELEVLLDRVLTLFRYIQGKDVFEAFFKKDLAKRLLLNKSASIDAEKSIISKLKQECGSGFTNKLEGMFKDMDLSRDIAVAFAQSQSKKDLQAKIGSEISVHVLTTGYWPAYPPAPLNVPKELLDHQEAFEKFYLSKHQGRRLSWHNSLAHCSLKARIGMLPRSVARPTCCRCLVCSATDKCARQSGRTGAHKELLVSLYQATILLLFNDAEQMTYTAIAQAVGMEDKELRVTLQSLACAKIKVLNKEPKGRDINDTDLFHFNNKFDVKQLRIKINSIQLKETQVVRRQFHVYQYCNAAP